MSAEIVKQKQAEEASRARTRSQSRLAAVQALYQMDLAQTKLEAVIAEFYGHRFAEDADDQTLIGADKLFFTEVLRGVVRRQRDIDPMLDQQLASGWSLKRIDSILRAILRSAAYELLERPEVPARVIINEYIEVAKAFFEGEEPKVVNGVVDKIARKLRPGEFAASS